MARRRKQPTTKKIAVAALVKVVAAEKQIRSVQRRLRKLEAEERKEREAVIGFRMPQDADDAETLPDEAKR